MSAVLEAAQPEVDLDSLEESELVRIIYEHSRGSEAQAAWQTYQARRLFAKSRWAEAQKRGPEVKRAKAQLMREYWRRSVILTNLTGYLSRDDMIQQLVLATAKEFGGRKIGEYSVRTWLTPRLDEQLRYEAQSLRELGITADTYPEFLAKQSQ